MKTPRRDFLKYASLAASTVLGSKAATSKPGMPGPFPGRVVGVEHPACILSGAYQSEPVRRMMEKGMTTLTGAPAWTDAWRSFFERGDVVGIKVCPVGGAKLCSDAIVLNIILDGLKEAGVGGRDVVVFNRYRQETFAAGIDKWAPGVRMEFASEAYNDVQLDMEGYDPDHFMEMALIKPGENLNDPRYRRSHVCKVVTRQVNKFINLPVLKHHQSAGVTIALKNMSHGMVNNVNRSHLTPSSNACGIFIPSVVSLPVIREKAVLHICDAVKASYHGGPGARPQFVWEHKTMYFATDPVALDKTGLKVIDAKRAQVGMASIALSKPDDASHYLNCQVEHIEIAGQLGLGIFDDKKIDVKRVTLLNKMRTNLALIALLTLSMPAAEKKIVTPAGGPPPVGPYSPGILAGDYLYLSGQGAAKPDGSFPATAEEQVSQCLTNVRRIVEAAGLTMEHVVYAHVYMKELGKGEDLDRAWRKVFPNHPPARATLGVSRMPTDTPVEITAVAVRDLSHKRVIQPSSLPMNPALSPGILTADRLYISGYPAAQTDAALDGMSEVLKAAGMDFRHMVFVNPYLTDKMPNGAMNQAYAKRFEFGNTPARATIKVASLPGDASIMFTGVAVRDLSKRQAIRPKNMAPSATASPCVLANGTLFCSAKSGFIPGPNSGIYASTVETQVRQTMRNLLDGLEEAGLTFGDVVATNVYVDDISEFARMNKVYGTYFGPTPPTRTTIQQFPPVERKADVERWPTLEQISLIAVK